MAKEKKLPRVFDYFRDKDPFAGGLSFCSGCPLELLLRFTARVLGREIVIVGTPSCSATVLYGQNTGSWHKLAYFSCLMTGVASSAAGISRYYRKIGQDITVVAFTGDGCAADVGFQPLSGAAERDENFIYICYDNEGYMNTGIQRSSTTPIGARTSTTPVGVSRRGKESMSKNLPLIMAMHKIPYTATATLSHLEDLAKKLLKAKTKKNEGLAYIHVFSPCPTGWGFASNLTIEICRLAVRTNYFPLWEAERGRFRLTPRIQKPRPLKELVEIMTKFSHLRKDEIKILEKEVHERYKLIEGMTRLWPLEATTEIIGKKGKANNLNR
ncbi:MAG: pyruvate synthase subunit PorB [Candidatus Aminicenantes bacterium]|nr:MAG: pyruvate synthase subunit PorB [Candidatus Aminicenantes bacterium]